MPVTIENVSAGYERGTIFRNLNLKLPEGILAGLVGPSGAGKTSLLRLLMGQLPLQRGQLMVNGQRVEYGRPPAGLGYVPQLETIDRNFPVTVEQVVMLGRLRSMSRWPWPSQADRRAVAELLKRLGLSSLAGRPLRELSGGQLQRVFLARALNSRPRLLLLDEPTSGVDVKTRNEVLALLGELHRQGISILLTTHDLNSVAADLPWVICVNGGVIAQGSPAEVFTNEILSHTYNAELEVIRHRGHLLVVEKQVELPEAEGLHQLRRGFK